LVDIFQPCVTFNKVNTYQWFKENTYYLEDSHDPYNIEQAFKRSMETDKFPLGIFYMNPDKRTFEENLEVYLEDKTPVYKRRVDMDKLERLIASKR